VTAGAADAPGAALTGEIADLMRQATGEDAAWRAEVGPATRLDGDLLMDSLELVALDGLLRARYGARIDLAAHVAGLDIDEIIALTVADVAAYVARRGEQGAR
jgi:acyl carrier protein